MASTVEVPAEPNWPQRKSALQQDEKVCASWTCWGCSESGPALSHLSGHLPEEALFQRRGLTCSKNCKQFSTGTAMGSTKGATFPPGKRKCVFLQLIFSVWSAPWRVRCQAGTQPGKAPSPRFPEKGEKDSHITRILSLPFGDQNTRV